MQSGFRARRGLIAESYTALTTVWKWRPFAITAPEPYALPFEQKIGTHKIIYCEHNKKISPSLYVCFFTARRTKFALRQINALTFYGRIKSSSYVCGFSGFAIVTLLNNNIGGRVRVCMLCMIW